MAYSRVERHVWDDERFRRWSRDVRDTWMYLLTNKHQNRIGMFVMDPAYVAADVQIDVDAARKALEFLDGTGRIMWDPETRLLFIRRHLKHNPIENPNVATATVRELFAQPFVEPLWEGLLEAVEKYCKMTTERGAPFCAPLVSEIRKRLSDNDVNRSPNGYPNGMGNGMGNPVPEPEPVVTTPPVGPPKQKRQRKEPERPLPNDWKPNDTHGRIATEEGTDLNREAMKFRDHARANDRRQVDWDASFRKWLRSARDYGGGKRDSDGYDLDALIGRRP
jgi:hypothetical protein